VPQLDIDLVLGGYGLGHSRAQTLADPLPQPLQRTVHA
jgi:hypothetical protein